MGVSEIGENPPSHHLTESGDSDYKSTSIGDNPIKRDKPMAAITKKYPALVMSK